MKSLLKKIYRKIPLSEDARYKISDWIKKSSKNNKFLSKEKFIKKVQNYDVISFDIFDTLISRIVYEPDDIFLLMGEKLNDNDFIKKRKNAENVARNKLKKDVNIDEIYQSYSEIYNTNIKIIKELEINLEIEFCVPRKDMLEVFNYLVAKEKTIILTSDMYLTKKVIEQMLKKCGYKGYSEFYLSNDLNKRKDTKEIWTYLKEKYKRKRFIHIGDNLISDYTNPKEFGIDALKIESSRELFSKVEMSQYVQEFISNKNISDSIHLGIFVNKIVFNSPFSDLTIQSAEDFGYIFHGPVINSFLSYICDNNKTDTMLFLAREGFYLQKLYKHFCKKNNIKEIKNTYFLASRKATITANIKSKNDLGDILNNDFSGTIKDYFKQLLDLDYDGENFEIELPNQKEEILPIVEKYSKEILAKCKKEKDNYLSYIKKEVGTIKNNKVSIIDLGYSGTIQYQLSKLTAKEFNGYYLTNSSKIKKYSDNSQLNFMFDINDCKEYEKIYHYSLILEYFLSAPFGQLIRFDDKKGKIIPVYNDETIDEDKQKTINELYDNIVRYMNDTCGIKKYYDYKPSLELLCRLYVCMVEGNLISRKVKDKFEFIDSFCSNQKRNVFKIISRY